MNRLNSPLMLVPSGLLAAVWIAAGCLFAPSLSGATITWDGGGAGTNWSTADNWSPNQVPAAGDDVVIPDGFNVTVDVAAVCASLTIEGGGSDNNLTISSGQSLTVSGAITINAGTGNGDNKFITVGAGTLSCASITMAATGSNQRNCELRVGTGTATVTGDITMNGAANENAVRFTNNGTLNIGGSFNGAGGGSLVTDNGSTVHYNGSGAQSVITSTYRNITFSGGGAKTLTGPVTVNAVCTFVSGVVNTTATNILIINNGSVTGASGASYVDGPIRKNDNPAFTFPTGDAGVYAPISISNTGSDYIAEYFLVSPSGSVTAPIDHISSQEYWQLTRETGSGTVAVTLSWDAAGRSGEVTDPGTLLVASSASSGGPWSSLGNAGTTGDNAAGTITAATASGSAFFTLASSAALPANPFPIVLSSFDGEVAGDAIHLTWTTASELNNDYMAVERSPDGLAFDEIGRVAGRGTTHEAQTYAFVDEYPLPGVNYYRLRQVDYDGTTEYHPVISVVYQGQNQLKFRAFPNPANEEITVQWTAPALPKGRETGVLRLLDTSGKVLRQYALNGSGGVYQVPVAPLPAGVYVLQLAQGGTVQTQRVVKK